jgi:hypothetical protein
MWMMRIRITSQTKFRLSIRIRLPMMRKTYLMCKVKVDNNHSSWCHPHKYTDHHQVLYHKRQVLHHLHMDRHYHTCHTQVTTDTRDTGTHQSSITRSTKRRSSSSQTVPKLSTIGRQAGFDMLRIVKLRVPKALTYGMNWNTH